MKKILIFIGGYLPGNNYGGPVTSISNLVENLGDNFEIFIVTRDRDFKSNKRYENISNEWNNVGKGKVQYLRDSEINYSSIKKIISELNPDLIYQNSFFEHKFLLNLLVINQFNKIKLLIAPRGEFFSNGLKQKALKKKVYIFVMKKMLLRKNVFFHATTIDEKEKILNILNIEERRVFTIENLATSFPENIEQVKKEKGILKLVYLGRVHPIKNLKFALKCLKQVKGNVEYDIYGPTEDKLYWKDCLEVIDDLPNNIKVRYKGVLNREDINRTLKTYDFLFLPTLTENYGHVIIEAMMANCPVIISTNTPWSDINDFKSGWALPLQEPKNFIKLLNNLVEYDGENYNEVIRNNLVYLQNKINHEKIIDDYENSFKKIMKAIN